MIMYCYINTKQAVKYTYILSELNQINFIKNVVYVSRLYLLSIDLQYQLGISLPDYFQALNFPDYLEVFFLNLTD